MAKKTRQEIVRSFLKRNWMILALLAVPPIVLFALLLRFGVNVPFWDQWETAKLIQKQFEGTLGFYDLWVQHNEHRILVPRIIMLGLANITQWNTHIESLVNFFLAGGISLLMFDMLRKTISQRGLRIALALLISVTVFSPIQWENWLWGWQIQWYVNLLAVTFSIWALAFWPKNWSDKWKLPAAIIAAAVATYSLGNGPIVWLLGALALVALRQPLTHLIIWISSAAITLATHYWQYSTAAGQPSKFLFLSQPINFLEYVLGYIGRPIAIEKITAIIAGTVIVGAILWSLYFFYKRRKALEPQMVGWLALAAYGGMSALTTAISRLGYGTQQALSNRYITISMVLVLSAAVIITAIFLKKKSKVATEKRLLIGVCVLIALTLANYVPGIMQMRSQSQYLTDIRNCTRLESPSDVCLLSAYPDKTITQERLNFLKSVHWGGY